MDYRILRSIHNTEDASKKRIERPDPEGMDIKTKYVMHLKRELKDTERRTDLPRTYLGDASKKRIESILSPYLARFIVAKMHLKRELKDRDLCSWRKIYLD